MKDLTRKEMIRYCVNDQIERGIIPESHREMQIKIRLTGWARMGYMDCKSWYDKVKAEREATR